MSEGQREDPLLAAVMALADEEDEKFRKWVAKVVGYLQDHATRIAKLEKSSGIEAAERRLGRAAVHLDNVVREYRRGQRAKGVKEAHVMYGVHEGERMAAFDEVNEATAALRKLEKEQASEDG